MSCVNITSKEFKDLCAQTGMSEGNVELAVHKFQNDLNTDKYPSIDYIQNYYTGTNTATGESQLELWNLNYDHDLVFNTEDLFKEAKEEALKYFESDAITTFEDKQGRKVLRVAPPTAAIEKGMQEILGSTPRDSEGNLLTSDDNIGEGSYSQSSETEIKGTLGDANLDNSRFDFGNRPKITLRKKFNWREHRGAEILATLSAKVQDKVTNNIESYLATRYSQGESHTFIMEDYVPNANATTTEVLDNIIKKSANKDLVELAKAVKKRLSKERGVYTTTRQSSRTGLRGQYTINNKIDLYPKATYGTTEAEARRLFESVILHEITHSITSDGLFANKQFREEVAEVMGQLNDYLVQNGIKSAKDLANTSDFYFFKNGKEFLSEFMSSPVLREALKQMEYKGTGKVKKSLFKKVVDAILRFFGMRPSSTLFERTEQIFEDISKYQVDENYNRTADIEANEEGVTKGVLGVNKEQLISLLGSTMYQNNIQEIAVKELVQNAFDAVKIAKYQGKITDPKIDITIDGKTREIIVSDNGMGMTPEIVQKAFFTMGGSYKGENVDNRLKSGGLGMAKMAFLFSSEYIELKTVKDGIETTVNTNPEEIKKDNFYIKTKQTNAPNGTTVKVQIPEHYIDENGKKRSIYFYHESSFLKKPLIGDVDITVRARPYYSESFIESKKEKIPKEYNKLGTAKSAFGDIEIYVTTDSNYKSRDAQILSSGLFQFDNYYLSWEEKPRMGVIINIKPSVDVRHSLYPFNNNRESFRGSVEEEIKDLNFLLLRIHRNVEALIYKRTFGSAISMDISDVSEVSADKIADEDILEEVKKSIEIFEDSSDSSDTEEKQYDLSNAVRKLRESTENQRRSTFDEGDIDIEDTNTKVDTSLLDINRPVFHNNTTMVLDKRAQDFCKDLGTHILTLKKLVQAAIKKGTFNTTGWISEKKLDTQYWGISIDTNYSGVNVHPRVFSFLSINPFSFSPAKGDKIAYYTSYIEHILFHEFNHNYINGENKNFTSNFPIVYSNMYGMGEAYIEWRKILEEIVKNNITTIEENYEKYLRSRNKAESFEGDSITRGDKSEDRSTESNRRVNENQRNEGVLSETTGALRGRAKEIEQSSQTESSFKEKEGSLKITPTRSVDIKAEAKGKISNKFIGYGVEGSSTLEYARQAGDKANTGVYNSDDTVFVSIGGKRGTLEKRKDAQNKTIDEALKAVRNGATLITDNKAYIERSDYNEGEKRLAEALKKEGAVYSETVVDGHTLGVWKRTTSQSTILTKNEDSGPIELSLFSDKDFEEPLSEGNEISEELVEKFEKAETVKQELEENYDDEGNLKNNPYTRVRNNKFTEKSSAKDPSKPLNPSSPNEKEETAAKKQKEEDEKFLQEQVKLASQLEALNNSSLLSSSELRDIIEQIVYSVSDHITEIMENPEKAKKIYGELVDKIDFDNVSRIEFINAIGASNILRYAMELFAPKPGKYDKISTIRKANLIIKNWGAVMIIANSVFDSVEGISFNKSGEAEVAKEVSVINVDDVNNNTDFDYIAEIEGNLQEHWQIESRTLDVLASMTALVRAELSKCYILTERGKDAEGNPIYDNEFSEFGIKKRVKTRDAVNSILRWIQGATDMPSMINKLKEKKDKNPWVSSLLEKLEDKSGKYSNFQSQFYGVFMKHHQVYSVVTKVNGKYTSKPINVDPAMSTVIDKIVAMYNIESHPLFTSSGINKTELGKLQEAHKELVSLLHKNKEALTEEQVNQVNSLLVYAANALGYSIDFNEALSTFNQETATKMMYSLGYIITILEKNKDNTGYNPFAFKGGIKGNLTAFLSSYVEKLEDIAPSCFYDSGKMYQNYVTPSYLTILMTKFKSEKDFQEFMQKEYGQYAWFRDQKNRDLSMGWKNSWLRELYNDPKAAKIFAHKVQLHFDKDSYMRGLSPEKYVLSVVQEYFSENAEENKTRVPAWFRVPIMSNKPSSEFIRFYSERGEFYKTTIIDGLKNIFNQELTRIQSVRASNYALSDQEYLQNYDKNGKRFQFLDWMNEYLDGSKKDTELGKLINKKIEGKKELTPNEEAQLLALSKEAIGEYMQARANSILAEWENKGIIKAASTISNIGKSKEEIRENLENFIWNDFYASNMILQLTIVDKAYYKNEDDIQKRLAELHSPGVRGNVYATDYHGNRVSDGTHRSVILTDFNKVRSNIIDNLTIIFDRKIEGAPEHLKLGYKSLKESIIAQFMEMNPVDGQAYNSPSSYRKKAFIFGKWSEKLEEAYKKIKDGTYTYNDLKVAFQILKPFLYGHAEKTREDGGLMSKIKVGMQYKNSEYLLILADAIMQNGDTGKPNLLRAIYDVMEESADKNPTKGIDTFQFESAVKTGAQNKVDLTTFEHMENGEKLAKEALEGAIYNEDGTYNLNTVNEIPFEYFALQQEIPMHYRDHEQIDGSQKRYTLCTDLETVYDGKEVLYKVGDEYLPAEKFRQVYEETYAENIRESLDKLALDLRLKGDKKARNIALSKLLLASITSRDGIEVISALTLDRNGNFKIPISEPVLYKRIEQLINSVIKNRVNKQEMPGGPLVQVSGVGLSEQLNIKFKDKNNGGLLMTKSEFEKSELYDKSKPLDDAFKEYLKKNQGGIAYYEALVSIQTMEIFSKFANKDGTIDLKAIEALNPNLLKLIGYRIPTEDKYSCLPIKIVGFLPKESGEGIMLPDEITTITDSDFDVDKMYIQRYELIISTKPRKKIFKTLLKTLKDSRIKQGLKPNTPILKEQLDMFLDNPEKMRFADDLMASLWDEYKKVAYVIKEPKKGRVYRNNKLIDMSYEVLTHESTVDKILTPGGFEALKKLGYGVEAYRTSGKSWEELQEMSPSELKDLSTSNKNIGFIDTQVHYYAQNAAASNVLGIFALNRIAHSILESKAYQVNIEKITKSSNPFIIGDTTFNGRMTLDPMRSVDGALISKTLGSGTAAAADAGKEPVLNLLNINSDTINVFITLIRLGTPLKTACLFMSQKVIKDAITEYNTANLEGYTSLNRIIEKKIKDTGFNDSSPINSEPFTEEEMIKGILETNDKNTYKTLSAFKKFLQISYAISMPTYVTRFNSISNAVGPLAVDNLIMEYKLIDFEDGTILDRNGNPLTPMDIIDDYPIISEFSKSLIYARDIFSGSATYSSTFNALIESLPKSLKNKITKNRELLSKLQDFYLSYILVASGVVDSKHCDYFINKFPKSFMASKMKEKYKDNPFIQAIQLSTDPKSKVPILKIETTGLDKQERERLSAGWYDFHKAEPRMSFGLFNYCFFKGGATFNPKTFIGLLPNNVKSEIDLYLDTYTHPPTILADIAADQFIRNNCHNNKIVPIIRGLHLISHSDGYVEISDKEDVSTMLNIDVFKVGNKNSYTVFKKYDTIKEGENTTLLYKEIKPLGNSGEFLEISADNIEKSIRNSDFVVEEQDPPSVKEDPLDHKDPNINKTPTQDTTELLYSILMGSRDRETSRLWIEARKKDTVKDKKGMSMYFSNRLTQMGIDATPELLDKLLAEIGFC